MIINEPKTMLIYANARLFNNRAAAKHFDSKISNACNATRAISADLTAALTNVVAAKNVLF